MARILIRIFVYSFPFNHTIAIVNMRISFPASFILVLGIALSVSSCRTSLPTAKSYPQAHQHTNDAFPEAFVNFHEDEVLGRVSHTDTQMQVHLRIVEPSMVMRLLLNGITIWVDSTASTRQHLGVVFPGAGPVIMQQRQGAGRYYPREKQEEENLAKFNPKSVAEIVKKRDMVFRYGEKAEFIENQMASFFLDDNNALNYIIEIPFDKLGITNPEMASVSVGVMSEIPTFQSTEQERERQPGGISGRPGSQYPRQDSGMSRQSGKSIETWVIFTFDRIQAETPAD